MLRNWSPQTIFRLLAKSHYENHLLPDVFNTLDENIFGTHLKKVNILIIPSIFSLVQVYPLRMYTLTPPITKSMYETSSRTERGFCFLFSGLSLLVAHRWE